MTLCAAREDWQGRLAEAEAKARQESDRKAAEALVAMNDRHDGIAGAIETGVVKLLREGRLTIGELRLAALTLESTQRVRRTSRGLDDPERAAKMSEPQRPALPRVIEWRVITPEEIEIARSEAAAACARP